MKTISSWSTAAIVLLLGAVSFDLRADPATDQAAWDARHPKQIFAHYMGCFPLGKAGTNPVSMRKTEAALRPDGPSFLNGEGGGWRDIPLLPADWKGTEDDGIDVEIRRAMRMGLDGFSVDTLAGEQTALDTIDSMFRVAEAHHYPFQITFCLDNPTQNPWVVKYLLDKHGNSPNLARRDGKPLFLAYRSCALQTGRYGIGLKGDARVSPEGLDAYAKAAEELEASAGQPLYLMFCLNGFEPGEDHPDTGRSADPAFWKFAATTLGQHFSGLSAFFWGGTNYNLAAQAAHDAGLDWGEPMWYQYQNLYWDTLRDADGTDLLRDRWDHAIANKATLLQCATWNDYNEHTGFTPNAEDGYAISDLTSLFIQKWKTGKMPVLKSDRVYLFYPPYPKGAPVYPFHETCPDIGQQLEVTTYLTAPATIVMPGRESDTRPGHDATWQAPAGLFVKKLPPTPGPVIAEVWRGATKVLTLQGRDPITDHPFRPDHTMVGVCTEDDRYFAEDFPNGGSFPPGYYGDLDKNGLPNWFEMYYSGKLGDFTAATGMNPSDNPAKDGSTNLEKYLSRSNPLVADKPLAAGDSWSLMNNPPGNSFNPETDAANFPRWRYLSGDGAGQWTAYPWLHYSEKAGRTGIAIAHSHGTQNTLNAPPPLDPTAITYHWAKDSTQSDGYKRWLELSPVPTNPVAIQWTCPGDGTYHVDLAADVSGHAAAQLKLIGAAPDAVWNSDLKADHAADAGSVDVHLKKGDTLSLQADMPESHGGQIEVTKFQVTLTTLS